MMKHAALYCARCAAMVYCIPEAFKNSLSGLYHEETGFLKDCPHCHKTFYGLTEKPSPDTVQVLDSPESPIQEDWPFWKCGCGASNKQDAIHCWICNSYKVSTHYGYQYTAHGIEPIFTQDDHLLVKGEVRLS